MKNYSNILYNEMLVLLTKTNKEEIKRENHDSKQTIKLINVVVSYNLPK